MDYDKTDIAASYDAGRGYSPKTMQLWLSVIESAIEGLSVEHILDLGCGTGRYSIALANHFGARVTGVDPSEKMLAEARKKACEGVHFMRGTAETIPLADGSVDLVFISMALHHFDDAQRAARECHRVLRPGGMICLRGGTPDRSESYLYSRFFPRALSLMHATLAPAATMEAIFTRAGFERERHVIVDSEVAASWPDFALKLAIVPILFSSSFPILRSSAA